MKVIGGTNDYHNLTILAQVKSWNGARVIAERNKTLRSNFLMVKLKEINKPQGHKDYGFSG